MACPAGAGATPVPMGDRVMQPDTRYAQSSGVNIAYQVLGEGPRDLVFVPGWVSNIEVYWEEPTLARFLTRLSELDPRSGTA